MRTFIKPAIVLSGLLAIAACKSTANQTAETKQEVTEVKPEVVAIAQDASIRKGVLPNGFTYYLHSTDVVKDKASYYIIQNVGSILENDDQQGLAHFLEHMAFNGTKSYPGKKFLNTMQENGLVFGRDINAYTAFDETVYNINHVPTTPEMTNHGLQILHDWANDLLLTEEEIDAERGVIKEEWRQRQNGGMRILEQTIDAQFGNSMYGKRLPIGLMSIVENFEHQVLRDFYHDWYRTDLQAIAIIGDIDVDAMEARIKEKFSKIPAVENPRERFDAEIADNEDFVFASGMDKEVARERINFSIRHKKQKPENTEAYLKARTQEYMATAMVIQRLNDLSREPDTPFRNAEVNIGDLSRLYKVLSVVVIPKPNQQKEAFTLTINELHRALKFGFTQAEVERQKVSLLSFYENHIKNLGNRGHKGIVWIMQNNYLGGIPMNDPVAEFESVKKLLDGITKESLQETLKSFYTNKNRVATVTAVEGRDNLNKESIQAIIKAAENNADLKPYVEETASKDLMAGVNLTGGAIVKTANDNDFGYTEYTLNNGIKVYYKYVNKDENSVAFNAISNGGISLLKEEDYNNASFIEGLATSSGIADFTATQLQKALTGKSARARASVSSFSEAVSGGSNTKDVETMFQLVNLRFTKPRFDEKAFNLLKQNALTRLTIQKKDLRGIMNDSLTVSIYGNNDPIRKLQTEEDINSANFDRVKELYLERFKNPADFKFFIVGDVKQEVVEPLLKKYIASLATNDVFENWSKDYKSNWVSNHIDKDIYLEMQNPKSSVNYVAKKEAETFSLKDKYVVSTLGSMLQLRYTETLRESEGGTYGASVRGFYSEKPNYGYGVSVNFDCNPDMVDKLVTIANNEFKKIASGDINMTDFDKTIKAKLKEREEGKENNGYDVNVIVTRILNGYDLNDPKNFEDIVKGIKPQDIQDMANRLLSKEAQSYEIVFKPKKIRT